MSTKTFTLTHATPCATCGGKGPHEGTAGHPYVKAGATIFSQADIDAFIAGISPDTVRISRHPGMPRLPRRFRAA